MVENSGQRKTIIRIVEEFSYHVIRHNVIKLYFLLIFVPSSSDKELNSRFVQVFSTNVKFMFNFYPYCLPKSPFKKISAELFLSPSLSPGSLSNLLVVPASFLAPIVSTSALFC